MGDLERWREISQLVYQKAGYAQYAEEFAARRRWVLEQLMDGRSQRAIAADLGVTPATISSIKRKADRPPAPRRMPRAERIATEREIRAAIKTIENARRVIPHRGGSDALEGLLATFIESVAHHILALQDRLDSETVIPTVGNPANSPKP